MRHMVCVVLAKRPDLTLVKHADGTKDNWTFLARALPEGVELISNDQFRSHTRIGRPLPLLFVPVHSASGR